MSKRQKNISSDSIPKIIILITKSLQKISTSLTVKFAKKIFSTPIKYKIPKREFEMDLNSKQKLVFIPEISKKIMTYKYGTGTKKALLVHGWSGRGTQLVKIADQLTELGYTTISFDAPAHGKSPGSTSLMIEFIASILELEKIYGKFDLAVGHSLGGMSILNSIKQGLNVDKAVIIGSGDSISDILHDFAKKLSLEPKIADLMRDSYEATYKEKMENYSGSNAAKEVNVPILVIHDKDDEDVPYTASVNIDKVLNNSELFLTNNLGHRKILGNEDVILKIKDFILN
ncbi:alpha/beta hydrolase [Flavobacterium sp.]|jgi:pimeloyl-ACP methyl ester carboxylesterase|uniref:alpha/beta fold hydrolase n=1 Tax=Flavobacterium sp. TaxID=239 RepID=UPI002A83FC24|nr:alpha/beta hydrolase [Flavobacterium sp.]